MKNTPSKDKDNQTKIREVIIIGSGPAGYSAAIYSSRDQLQPLLFAGEKANGQLMYTTEVENFAGFPEGVMGPKLMMNMRAQAERFGTEIIDRNITRVDFSQRPFKVWQGDDIYQARGIIIATGAESITLGLENEEKLLGRGVSTCAVCDAAFFREKVVYVVGGGDSAVEDTMALVKFASKVYMVVRRDQLRASKIMQERVRSNKKVKLLWNTEIIRIYGKDKVERLLLKNNQTNHKDKVKADGLFFAIGHKPITKFMDNQVDLDNKGYILTPLNGLMKQVNMHAQWLAGYPTKTSVEGVFAAGDVVDFRYRQAITAAAYGSMAALDVEKWLESR